MTFRQSSLLLALLLTCACADTDQLEPDRSGRMGAASLRVVQPTPEQQERQARQFKRCLPEVADSAWSVHTDQKQRAQLRLPKHHRREAFETDSPDGTAWLGSDSSVLMLEFNTGDGWQTMFGIGSDEPAEMVDDSACSIPFAGRVALVMRFHTIGAARDTTWVATVNAGIRKNLGIEGHIVSRQKSARDQLLSAISTLQLRK